MEIRRGQVIANRFVIKDLVGRGGMGRIFKADDNVLNEEVALKTLLPQYVQDQMILDRFMNEARIARQLSHPNIVRVHDIGTADGVVYISMEMLQGRSMREMLERLAPGQRIPVHAVLRMFDALCAALDYAHRYTVHRDIKPENVMVLKDGSVKIMDFGISKLKSNPRLTSASMVMGTPHYMSPEQLKDSSKVDGRADVYSLGVMLYEVLTGQTPTGVPRPASETARRVPPALDPIIAKCVDPDPAKRYQTAGELREALRAVRVQIETKQKPGQPKSNWEVSSGGTLPVEDSGWRRRAIGAVAVLAILGLTAAGLYVAEQRRLARVANAGTISAAPLEAAPEDLEREWLRHLLEKAEASAPIRVRAFPEDLRPVAEAILAEATAWSERAAENRNTPGEARAARNALSCYWALHDWQEGAVFVPPGEDGPGFFLDTRPVSAEAFAGFAAKQGGAFAGVPASGTGADPVTQVTAYEAMAFLAAQESPRTLPTQAQWARAVQAAEEEAFFDRVALNGEGDTEANEADETAPLNLEVGEMLGEWTETPGGSAQSDPFLFGQALRIVGDAGIASLPYEARHPSVGFRGASPMPRDLRVLDDLFTKP